MTCAAGATGALRPRLECPPPCRPVNSAAIPFRAVLGVLRIPQFYGAPRAPTRRPLESDCVCGFDLGKLKGASTTKGS